MNINEVRLAGRITRDPEMRVTPNGTAICQFGIAVNRKFSDKNGGGDREEVMFADCEAWAKTAETISKHFSKGKEIYVAGRLKTDEWTDKNTNQKRTKLKVVVDSFQFVGGPDKPEQSQQQRPAQRSNSMPNGAGQGGASAAEDDVPFAM